MSRTRIFLPNTVLGSLRCDDSRSIVRAKVLIIGYGRAKLKLLSR